MLIYNPKVKVITGQSERGCEQWLRRQDGPIRSLSLTQVRLAGKLQWWKWVPGDAH